MELSDRILNRTLLARQHLLERSPVPVSQLCEHLVGLQAQDVTPPYVGLWSRISDFDPATVSVGLENRSLVRITLLRATIHLVTAADAVRIAPHIQPELEKIPFRKGFFYGAMVGLDPEEVRARGEKVLGAEPMSSADLRARAVENYPDRDPTAVTQTWLYQLPLLQTPPRGLWRNNSRPVWSRIEPWLDAPLDDAYPVQELVLRYLRAFGPATTMDVQTWSRLLGIREILAGLGERVRTYTDERGRVLYDAADAELADPDLPAPVGCWGGTTMCCCRIGIAAGSFPGMPHCPCNIWPPRCVRCSSTGFWPASTKYSPTSRRRGCASHRAGNGRRGKRPRSKRRPGIYWRFWNRACGRRSKSSHPERISEPGSRRALRASNSGMPEPCSSPPE